MAESFTARQKRLQNAAEIKQGGQQINGRVQGTKELAIARQELKNSLTIQKRIVQSGIENTNAKIHRLACKVNKTLLGKEEYTACNPETEVKNAEMEIKVLLSDCDLEYDGLIVRVSTANTEDMLVEINNANIALSQSFLDRENDIYETFKKQMRAAYVPIDSVSTQVVSPLQHTAVAAGGTRKYRKNKKGTRKHKKRTLRKKNRPRKTRKR